MHKAFNGKKIRATIKRVVALKKYKNKARIIIAYKFEI